jgi:hypothetical protein
MLCLLVAVSISYTNPVITTSPTLPEIPDPGVSYAHDLNQWVAVTTTANSTNAFAIFVSPDLVHWTGHGFIWTPSSRGKPHWAGDSSWFAPEVHRVNGTYWLLFSAEHRVTGNQTVGIAWSAGGALGPYTDIGHPLLGDNTNDPTLFQENNIVHLIWKAKSPARIYAQRLLLQLPACGGPALDKDPAVQLINVSLPWEREEGGGKGCHVGHAVVEGPTIVSRHTASAKHYYLFYAAENCVAAPDHKALGVAHASAVEVSRLQVQQLNQIYTNTDGCLALSSLGS